MSAKLRQQRIDLIALVNRVWAAEQNAAKAAKAAPSSDMAVRHAEIRREVYEIVEEIAAFDLAHPEIVAGLRAEHGIKTPGSALASACKQHGSL